MACVSRWINHHICMAIALSFTGEQMKIYLPSYQNKQRCSKLNATSCTGIRRLTIYAGVVFDGVHGVEELPSDLRFCIRINGNSITSWSTSMPPSAATTNVSRLSWTLQRLYWRRIQGQSY